MDTAKSKITKAVEDYIKLAPAEFNAFKAQVREQRHALADERYGVAEGSGVEMRALFEMPVNLHEMIANSLNVEELTWFKSGGASKNEGGRWFATNFPAFRLPDRIT